MQQEETGERRREERQVASTAGERQEDLNTRRKINADKIFTVVEGVAKK